MAYQPSCIIYMPKLSLEKNSSGNNYLTHNWKDKEFMAFSRVLVQKWT